MKPRANHNIPRLVLNKEILNNGNNNRLYRTIQPYNISTLEQYKQLVQLIDIINAKLFNKTLPLVMLSFYKDAGICGKIENVCWEKDDYKCYGIVLNPNITKKSHKDFSISLVLTLYHLQQKIANTSSRVSYHNSDFSDGMEQLGLLTKRNENN